MKLPKLSINLEEYEQELFDVIQSEDCLIFFDTNILSFLYKINESAREEFYAWIQNVNHRCFLPKWNAHEYMKKVTANQDDEYLGEIKRVSEAVKSFTANMKYVRMYIDNKVLKGHASYDSADDYIIELESVEKSLQKLANVIKPQETVKVLRQEIQKYFEDKILETDIYAIVRDIGDHGQNRYHCNLPPGFQDVNKEFNSYGDLVMWREILDYCKSRLVKKCVLVSRDVKKDFVYKVDVGKNSCKLTDERLKDEFKINTGSDQFYIVDIERLVSIFSHKKPSSFEALAKAIQIIDISKEKHVKNNDEEIISASNEEGMDILQGHSISETDVEPKEVGDDGIETNVVTDYSTSAPSEVVLMPGTGISISNNARQDADFVSDGNKGLIAIIDALKSHTWPRQNGAIIKLSKVLSELDQSTLGQNRLDALFVLGRNIYQAACGNSFSAIQYLQRIDGNLSPLSAQIRDYIVCGALFEIFFNSQGEIRTHYKYRHSLSLLKLDKEKYTTAFDFIETELLRYKDTHIVYPRYTDQETIAFNVSSIIKQSDSPITNNKNYNYIEEIKIENNNVQIQSFNNSFFPTIINQSVFIHELAQMYCLPEDKIRILFREDINNDLEFAIDGSLTTIIQSE